MRTVVLPVLVATIVVVGNACGPGTRQAVDVRPPSPVVEAVAPAVDGGTTDIQALIDGGRYAEAETAARELLARLEASHGGASAELVPALDLLVESRWRGGKPHEEETAELAERAIALGRETLGADDVGTTRGLNNLAVISFMLGDFRRAEPLWRDALRIRTAALGPDHPDVGEAANNLANLLQVTGDFDGSRALYEQALAVRTAALGAEHPKVAQTLNNLSSMLGATGDYARALDVGERALAIGEAAYGPEHPRLARTLTNLCEVLWNLGDRETARARCDRAVTILESAMPGHPAVAATLNNVGSLLQQSGQADEALPLYERAVAIAEAAYDGEHPNLANYLDSLALAREDLGALPEAEAIHERALAMRGATLGEVHPDTAQSLVNLAGLVARRGDTERAAALYGRSIEVYDGSVGGAHPFVADARGGLAAVRARGGDMAGALDEALASEGIARDHLRLTGRSLAEEQALRYAAVRARGLDLALSLGTRLDPEARRRVFDGLVRSRAVVLDAMAARRRAATRTTDPRVAALATELSSARARLANLSVRGLGGMEPETYRAFLDEARVAKERAERDLAAASLEFAGELERGRIGLDEVERALPPGAALVAYVQYEHTPDAAEAAAPKVLSYAAIVFRAGSAPAVVGLGPATSVDAAVAAWKREAPRGAATLRRDADEALEAYRPVGLALRRVIWDPLASALGDAARAFIVPDGSLNLVSFASLPLDAGGYLVESDPLVHYLSAERDLVDTTETRAVGEGLFVIGGPAYDELPTAAGATATRRPSAIDTTPVADSGTRSACGSFDTLRFDPLPAAAREADEIAALWREQSSGVTHLSGAGASEASLKAMAGGRRVVHLATHGFFLGGDCSVAGAGSRGFSVVQEEEAPKAADFALSPLLMSGLAFAGANLRADAGGDESGDDGVLTGEEIASLDLGGVEWAVLSACDTGVGEIQAGEGVFGLRRAMQVAGVRTLVMSLWPVDDEATRAWMRALYTARLRDKLDTAQSVRTAARVSLAARRAAGESDHPFYWAAFVAAGDHR